MNRSACLSVPPKVIQTSDEELVRLLFAEHGGALYAFCVRWTGDAQRAEDIVQEVFLRAWRNLSSLDLQHRPPRPWLMSVARNLLTDAHRARQSRPVLVDDERTLASVTTDDEIDRAVESWQMAAALQRLSPHHREVLVQAHWMGRSVAETAAYLGVPPGTVKSRTYYAIRALRLLLEEMGIGT